MAVADILGREAEVQAVGRFLDGPAPAALILEGPAGIGKTTVWQAAWSTHGSSAIECS